MCSQCSQGPYPSVPPVQPGYYLECQLWWSKEETSNRQVCRCHSSTNPASVFCPYDASYLHVWVLISTTFCLLALAQWKSFFCWDSGIKSCQNFNCARSLKTTDKMSRIDPTVRRPKAGSNCTDVHLTLASHYELFDNAVELKANDITVLSLTL